MSDPTATDRPASPKAPRGDRWTAVGEAVSLVRPPRPSRPATLAAAPRPVVLDLARTALVVVDMQNDFCHPDGWFPAVRGVDPAPLVAPVGAINRLVAACRPAGIPVVWLNWGVRADGANLPAHVLDKATDCGAIPGYGDPAPSGRGDILVAGSWGAEVIDGLDRHPDDLVVHKHRLSGFKDSVLDSVLRRAGVTTLLFTGINIDRCVFATLMDGAFEGYDVVLVEDATATPSPAYVRDAILYLTRLLYGFTTGTADLLAALAAAPSPAPDPDDHPGGER